MTKPAAEIFEKYRQGNASPEEKQLVEDWFLEQGAGQRSSLTDEAILNAKEEMWEVVEKATMRPAKVKTLWPRIAAAASIVIAVSAGSYFIFHKKQPVQQLAQNQPHDILPGSDKAILKTHGRQISITDAKSGLVAQMGSTSITKTANGKLVYNNTGTSGAMVYDTLIVPRGGQHLLQLADGSKILLDADSKLRYPERFAINERRIELISGHGRFYVHHDATIPFYVDIKGQTMKDIGTDFDISAYDNEESVKTTLVDGSVSVSVGSQKVILKPGQQSSLRDNHINVQDVDVDNVIAWSNGFFAFKQADIKTVMRQFSRWYDVDVEYEGQVPTTRITGKAYRNVNASEALTILTDLGIHYHIENKKIIIIPN